jgi:hypothetical protein
VSGNRLLALAIAVIAFPLFVIPSRAQLIPLPTGANRADVSWHELSTAHFTIVYHDGLDSVARVAADVAEAVYPVVTANLRTTLDDPTLLFLSDLDDVPNAFAFGDRYMFVWMRGILADMAPGGIRSAGRAKWLRAVITHEFTHIVIEHATKTWTDALVMSPGVPRWFHEGTARAMEPDQWTPDLDLALRVAAVNARLGYDLLEPGVLDGTLLYETGHSLVRYMLWRFGDSTIARILAGGRSFLDYDFDAAVSEATGRSLGEIRGDWLRAVTAMYAAEYAGREEAEDFTPTATDEFDAVFGARYSNDRHHLALLASRGRSRPNRLYVVDVDDSLHARGRARMLVDGPGIDDEFSWSPDGSRIVIAKYRHGAHRALLTDLFVVDVASGAHRRLTSDAALRDPAWSPDGRRIVAVRKHIGRDDIVLVDAESGAVEALTHDTSDVQLYTPSWSPDGARIAVSLFDADGARAIAIVERDGSMRTVVRDTSNNRYPVWSPDGRRIAFTTYRDGAPNINIVDADGSNRVVVTAVGGGLGSMQWVPASDTLLALSFDSRDRIVARLVPTTRRAEPAPEPRVLEKFTAWRSASFARHVPPPEEITRAVVVDSGGYSSLAHMAPILPLLPLAEPGISGTSDRTRLRPGFATFWSDPQFKHIVFGYLTWKDLFADTGGELYYIDNQLPWTTTVRVDYSIAYRRIVDGHRYYQRNRNLTLGIDLPLADADALDIGHHVVAGVARRSLEPWNAAEFTRDSTGADPVTARLSEVFAGYRYGSRSVFLDARYRRSEPSLGSDLAYHRLDATLALRLPIVSESDLAIVARAEGAAHFGAQLPQEELRLEGDDQLEGRALAAFDLLDLERSYRVRGVETITPGERILIASVGLANRIPFFEDLFPLLSLFRPETVVFGEAGSAWYADRSSITRARWRVGAGGELRTQILPHLWGSLGLAYGLGDGWDGYFRLSQGL